MKCGAKRLRLEKTVTNALETPLRRHGTHPRRLRGLPPRRYQGRKQKGSSGSSSIEVARELGIWFGKRVHRRESRDKVPPLSLHPPPPVDALQTARV